MGEGAPGSALTPARRPQDVFLMIRRHKTTIFTDAKESSTVFELKRIVEGILKRPPDEQRLYKVRPGAGAARRPRRWCKQWPELPRVEARRCRRSVEGRPRGARGGAWALRRGPAARLIPAAAGWGNRLGEVAARPKVSGRVGL